MKNFLRIISPSVPILTRLVIIVITLFAFFFTPSSADAKCDAGSCAIGSSRYSCNFSTGGTGPGSIAHYCCNDGPECTAYISASSSSGSVPAGNGGSGVLKVNPEGNCTGGIDTALGCIPYETKGFTSALLGFIIGLVGLIAIVVMLVATVMIMTGGSNPEQIKKGKELFTGGITGLLFIVFSVTILRIIAGDIIKLPGFF